MWVLVKVMVMDGVGCLEITQQLRSMLTTNHQHLFRACNIRVISIGSVFDAAKKRNPNVISSSNNRPSVILVFLSRIDAFPGVDIS
jgi:hypothetical protein